MRRVCHGWTRIKEKAKTLDAERAEETDKDGFKTGTRIVGAMPMLKHKSFKSSEIFASALFLLVMGVLR